MVLPLNEGVVCSGGVTTSTSAPTVFGMTACELKIGKGMCFISLLEATERFKMDSVATRYVRNLLDYTLGDGWDGSRAFPIDGGKVERFFSEDQLFFVDLRRHANRSFIDEKENDKVGGWDDNGPRSDMRQLPVGRRRMGSLIYDVIDPKANHNKACIVLAGELRPYFAEQVTGIPVGRRTNRLYFLQTGCYITNNGKRIGHYVVHYRDGRSVEIPLVAGENIADWSPYGGPPAKVPAVWKGPSGNFTASLFQFTWENPRPAVEITGIDMVSAKTRAVPVLVAITGEKYDGGNP